MGRLIHVARPASTLWHGSIMPLSRVTLQRHFPIFRFKVAHYHAICWMPSISIDRYKIACRGWILSSVYNSLKPKPRRTTSNLRVGDKDARILEGNLSVDA